MTVPLEIFPDNGAGYESCDAALTELRTNALFRQAKELACERYQLTPQAGRPEPA